MDKQSIKDQFHKLIDSIDDESVLQTLYEDAVEYSTGEEKDVEISEAEMASIELGLKQIEEGKTFTHEEVLQHLMQWRNKK